MKYSRFAQFFMRRFRKRRVKFFCSTFPPSAYRTILDIGGTSQLWDMLDGLYEVTLLNEDPRELTPGRYECVIGDGRNLRFPDNSFDVAFSNSVIEHVETWRNMKAFASETRRVGRSYYVQTPYFWFPIDPHFYAFPMFHWFPRQIRAKLLRSLPLAYAGRMSGVDKSFQAVDDSCLLDASQMKFLFPEAAIHFERFAGLRKSVIAISCH